MTARAYIQDDPFRDGIRVAISPLVDDTGRAHVYRWTQTVETVAEAVNLPDDAYLVLPGDEGRALYEALARHYGDYPSNPTDLRADYLAERARVDQFINYVTGDTP